MMYAKWWVENQIKCIGHKFNTKVIDSEVVISAWQWSDII